MIIKPSLLYRIVETIHCKIESYFCWHGIYGTWISTIDGGKIYTEYEQKDSECWICNTWRGKIYLYFHYRFEYLHELVSVWEDKKDV